MDNWFRFRILPITVAMCCFSIVVKFTAIMQGESHIEVALAAEAVAEEEAAPAAEEKPKEDAKPEESAKEESEEAPAESSSKETTKDAADKKDTEKKTEETSETAVAPEDISAKCRFNQIEVDVLQNLSARRQEIEKWAKDIQMQETVLKATEVQLDQKLADLQTLKDDVQSMLKKYEGKEAAELKSLVKIYENMKPVDAARIFNEMEMEILLEVVDMMSERKAAPVLANMIPTKAKDLTIDLAEKRRLKIRAMESLGQ